ncbi:hypothetical protein JTB14_017857 [Gonioctena quinquepunctata]|nr:hypothetical protein JTB14_017857 [Gonioctena quinquepunctata]
MIPGYNTDITKEIPLEFWNNSQASSGSGKTEIDNDYATVLAKEKKYGTEITSDQSTHNLSNVSNFNYLNKFVAPSSSTSISKKLQFLSSHPIHPTRDNGVGKILELPFNPNKLYQKLLTNGETLARNWLSNSVDLHRIFCCICMTFTTNNLNHPISSFETGFNNFEVIYDRVFIHEISRTHGDAVKSYFLAKKDKTSKITLTKKCRIERLKEYYATKEF